MNLLHALQLIFLFPYQQLVLPLEWWKHSAPYITTAMCCDCCLRLRCCSWPLSSDHPVPTTHLSPQLGPLVAYHDVSRRGKEIMNIVHGKRVYYISGELLESLSIQEIFPEHFLTTMWHSGHSGVQREMPSRGGREGSWAVLFSGGGLFNVCVRQRMCTMAPDA